MSEYCPPLENLPIFNNDVFENNCQNDKAYLEYPIAQGNETLQGITVQGNAIFNYPITSNNVASFNSTVNVYNTSTSFNISNLPVITNYTMAPSANNLITKYYADNTYTGGSILATNNIWSGTNSYNNTSTFNATANFTSQPTCSLTPVNSYDIANLGAVNTAITNLKSANNTWSGTNTFSNLMTLYTTTMPAGTNTKLSTSTPTYYINANSNAFILKDYWHYLKYVLNDTQAIGGSIDGAWLQGYAGGVLASGNVAYTNQIHFQWKNGKNYSLVPIDINGLLTSTAGITASTTQTINFGTNAPTMSGANIGSATIPDGSLSSNIPLKNASNTFTGLNLFQVYCPRTGVAPTLNNDLCNKLYVDSSMSGKIIQLLSANNSWTGTNTFNSYIPTSTLTPTLSTEFVTKSYSDAILSNTNTWSGDNTFSNLLTCSNGFKLTGGSLILPSSSINDSALSSNVALLNGTNAWSGTNTFNTNLPTSTITPTTGTELITKTYADSTYLTSYSSLLSSNNVWTGTNSFYKGIVRCGNNDDTQINIGVNTLGSYITNGGYNTAIGINVMNSLTSGYNNIAIGNGSGNSMTTNNSGNLIMGAGSGGAFITNCSNNLVIGGGMGVKIGTGNNISNNVAIGGNCMTYVADNCGANTAIGPYALYNDSGSGFAGIYNTAIGPNAGVRLGTNGSNCCFIGGCNGAPSNVSPTFSNYNYSTTIGVDAVCTGSNQIVLGTSAETVYHKGASDFSGNLNMNQNTISNVNLSTQRNYTSIVTVSTYPYTMTASQSGCLIIFTNGGTVNLPSPVLGLDYYFFNNNTNAATWINLTALSGVIYPANGGTTIYYLYPKRMTRLRSDGTNWYVIEGSNSCVRMDQLSVIGNPANFGIGGNIGALTSVTRFPLQGQGTALTASATIGPPLYRVYTITATSSITITLPQINSGTSGCHITFRKLGGTIGLAHVIAPNASNSIVPFGSVTAGAVGASTALFSTTATASNYVSVQVAWINGNSWAILA